MKVDLNKKITNVNQENEISLFRKFSNTLSNNYSTLFVRETHSHYVEFKSKAIGKIVKREISDLWLITFSPKQKIIRMTFLQAKFEKKKRKNISPFKFTGEYFQYELLSDRPKIKDKSKLNLPNTVLSGTDYETIGTFGIFYLDKKNKVDFAYCSASKLTYRKGVKSSGHTKRTFSFPIIKMNKSLSQLWGVNNFEMVSTLDIDSFVKSLVNLEIGAPIQKSNSLVTSLNIILNNISNNGSVINDLLSLIKLLDLDLNSNLSGEGNPNLLIINSDGK